MGLVHEPDVAKPRRDAVVAELRRRDAHAFTGPNKLRFAGVAPGDLPTGGLLSFSNGVMVMIDVQQERVVLAAFPLWGSPMKLMRTPDEEALVASQALAAAEDNGVEFLRLPGPHGSPEAVYLRSLAMPEHAILGDGANAPFTAEGMERIKSFAAAVSRAASAYFADNSDRDALDEWGRAWVEQTQARAPEAATPQVGLTPSGSAPVTTPPQAVSDDAESAAAAPETVQGPWKYATAALVAVAVASTAGQLTALFVQGVANQYDWRMSTGGLVALVAALYMRARCTSWRDFRRKIWLWVIVVAALAFGLTTYMTSDLEPSLSGDASATSAMARSATDASSTPGQEGADEASSATADAAALESIDWADRGGVPVLTFDSPLGVTDVAIRPIADGDGGTIQDGMNVSLDYVVYSGADGSVMYSTYDEGTPEVVSMTEGQVLQGLYDALVGNGVGTTLIYAYPDTTSTDGSSVIMAVTASDATMPLDRATGTTVESADGLPTVTLAANGMPSIDFSTAGDMPTELVVQPLIKGDGTTVSTESQVTVNYTGWLWDGEQFDSSWDRGAASTFGLGSVIPGWTQGLAGQTIGTQVLLVIPPDLGYGDTDSGSIPAGSTLVFVVDILAAE